MLSNLAACISQHPFCKSTSHHHWPCPHTHRHKRSRTQDLEADEAAGAAQHVTEAATLSVVYAAAIAGTATPATDADQLGHPRKPLLALFKGDLIDIDDLAEAQRARRAAQLDEGARRQAQSREALALAQPCRFCGRAHVLPPRMSRPASQTTARVVNRVVAVTMEDVETHSASPFKAPPPSTSSSQSHVMTPTASGKSSTSLMTAGKSSTRFLDTPDKFTSRARADAGGDGGNNNNTNSNSGSSGGVVRGQSNHDCCEPTARPPVPIFADAATAAPAAPAASTMLQTPMSGSSTSGRLIVKTRAQPSRPTIDEAPVSTMAEDAPPRRPARVFRGAMYPAQHYQAREATRTAAAAASVPTRTTTTAPSAPAVIIMDKGTLMLPQHPLQPIIPAHPYPPTSQVRVSGTRTALNVMVRWSASRAAAKRGVAVFGASPRAVWRDGMDSTSVGTAVATAAAPPTTSPSSDFHATSVPTALSSPLLQSQSSLGRSVCSCCAHCQLVMDDPAWSAADDGDDVSLDASQYQPTGPLTPPLKHVSLISPTASSSADGLANHFGHSLSFATSLTGSTGRTAEPLRRPHASMYPAITPEKQSTGMSQWTQGASVARETTTTTICAGLSSSEPGTPMNSELAGTAASSSPTPLMLSSSNGGGHVPYVPHAPPPSQQELFKAIVQRRKSSLRQDMTLPRAGVAARVAAHPLQSSSATPLSSSLAPSPGAQPLSPDGRAAAISTAYARPQGGLSSSQLAASSTTLGLAAPASQTASPNSVGPFYVSVPAPSLSVDGRVLRQPSLRSQTGSGFAVATAGTASTIPEGAAYDILMTPNGHNVVALPPGARYAAATPGVRFGTPEDYLSASHASMMMMTATPGATPGLPAPLANAIGAAPSYPWSSLHPQPYPGSGAMLPTVHAAAAAGASPARDGSDNSVTEASLQNSWCFERDDVSDGPLGPCVYGMKPSATTIAGASSLATTPGPPRHPYEEEGNGSGGGVGWLVQSRQSSDFWDHAVTPLLRPIDPNDLSVRTTPRYGYGIPSAMFNGAGAYTGSLPSYMPLAGTGDNTPVHHLSLPPAPGTATPYREPSPYARPSMAEAWSRSPGTSSMRLPEPAARAASSTSPPPSPAWTRPKAGSHAVSDEATVALGGALAASATGHKARTAPAAAAPTWAPTAAAALPTTRATVTTATSPCTPARAFCRYEDVHRRRVAHTYAPTSAYCPGLHDRLTATRRLDAHRRQHAEDHCYSLHNHGIASATASAATTPAVASAPQTAAAREPSLTNSAGDEVASVDRMAPWFPFDDNYHRDAEMLERLSLTTTSSCAFGAGVDGLCWHRWVAPDVAARYDAHFAHLGDDDDDDDDDNNNNEEEDDKKKKKSVKEGASTSVLSQRHKDDDGALMEGVGRTALSATMRSGSTHSRSTSGAYCTCSHPLTPATIASPVAHSASQSEEAATSPSSLREGATCLSSHNPKAVPPRALPQVVRTSPLLVEVLPGRTPAALTSDAAVAPRNWSDEDDEDAQAQARRCEAAAAARAGQTKAGKATTKPTVGSSAVSASQSQASHSQHEHARPSSATESGSPSAGGSGGGFRLFRSLRKSKKGEASAGVAREPPGVILHSDESDKTRRRASPIAVGTAAGPSGASAPASSNAVGFLPFTNWFFGHMEERRARKEEKHARKQRAKELARVELWRKEKAEQQLKHKKDKAGSGSSTTTMTTRATVPPAGYTLGDAATMSPCSPRDMLSDVKSDTAVRAAMRRSAAAAAVGTHKGTATAAMTEEGSEVGPASAKAGVFAHSFPGVLVESANTAATERARRALMVDAVMETFSASQSPSEATEEEEAVATAGTEMENVSALPVPVVPRGGRPTPACPMCARCHKAVPPSATDRPHSRLRGTGDAESGSSPDLFLVGPPGGLYRRGGYKCLAPRRTGKFNVRAQAPLTVAQLEQHKAFYAAEAAVAEAKLAAKKANTEGLRKLVKGSRLVMSAEAAAVAAMWLHDAKRGVPAAAVHHWYEDGEEDEDEHEDEDAAQTRKVSKPSSKPTPAQPAAVNRAGSAVIATASQNAAASSGSTSSSHSSSNSATTTPASGPRRCKADDKSNGGGASHRRPDAFALPASMPVRAARHDHAQARTREAAEEEALAAANVTLQRKRAAIESWLRHIE